MMSEGLPHERAEARYVVLDDDPTGVQTLAGIHVLLAWDAGDVAAALRDRPSVHLVTNARAFAPERARAVTAAAARTAIAGAPGAVVVLRGDSTLRGHLLEEVEAVASVVSRGRVPPLLLVPALPSAGRVTIAGLHLIERDGHLVPLHETEYASDGVFSYRSARLLEWAEERSAGLFRADDGRELHLDDLRAGGPTAVVEALEALAAAGRPAVLAPDAVAEADLELVAEGYRRAVRAGTDVLVRCAPAFVGVLAGTTANGLVLPPGARDGMLVVCGSYVPATTAQLRVLIDERPSSLVEVDPAVLASAYPESEVGRAASAASERIREGRLAVLSTSRLRPLGTETLDAGERIAAGIAAVAGAIEPRPSVVVAKGGITACVTLRDGLGVAAAEVVGPVLPGVSRWRADDLDYIVVPGNVGGDRLLADIVALVLDGEGRC
jgi:uncharacterized protein YgbK (DUF1537 family)